MANSTDRDVNLAELPDASAQGGASSGLTVVAANKLNQDYERLRVDVGRLKLDLRRLAAERDSADSADDADDPAEPRSASPGSGPGTVLRGHPLRTVILLAIALIAAVAALRAWRYAQTYQSTDDAEIDAHIDPVSARISGTITRVYVEDNQQVKKGALLVEIDSSRYTDALERARANEDEAAATVEELRSAVTSAQAQLAAAEANGVQARRDAHRWADLKNRRIVSPHESEQYETAASVATADSAAVRAEIVAYQKTLLGAEAARKAAHAARAQVELNLSYTKIFAPADGIVGKRSAEAGQRVQPGEDLMAIVRNDDLWVTANFKETQLGRIHPGDSATIHVDSLDQDLTARVESLAGASGEKYAVLPAENATGNYVKVVQRIPIRIRLRRGQQEVSELRPGMSVEATVWTR